MARPRCTRCTGCTRGRPRALLLPLAALLLTACAGAHGSGATRQLPPDRLVRLPLPSDPAATHYDTTPTAHPGGDAGALANAMAEHAAARGVTLTPDGRLAALATWVHHQRARSADPTTLPPQLAIDAAAQRLGIPEPTPALLVYRINDADALPARAAEGLGAQLAEKPPSHLGAFVQRSPDGGASAVIALTRRRLSLRPLPLALPTGSPLQLHGQLLPGYTQPELIVMRPDGEMTRSPLGPGPAIAARARTGAPGRYGVELLAHGPRGLTVVANFPVYVGTAPPPHIEVHAPTSTTDGDPAADPDAELLLRLNDARSRRGLPLVARRADLDAVARAHSQEMVARGYVGHTSPTTGTVVERLETAGIHSPLSAENIGRAYSPGGVHAGLMASPGHRANILHPQATHVGIGHSTEPEGERSALLATQVFIHVPSELDPDAARETGLQALAEARAARGVSALQVEPALDSLAASAAAHYFSPAQPGKPLVSRHVERGLPGAGLGYRQYQVAILEGASIDLSTFAALLAADLRGIGLAFAQGHRGDSAHNPVTIALVVLAY